MPFTRRQFIQSASGGLLATAFAGRSVQAGLFPAGAARPPAAFDVLHGEQAGTFDITFHGTRLVTGARCVLETGKRTIQSTDPDQEFSLNRDDEGILLRWVSAVQGLQLDCAFVPRETGLVLIPRVRNISPAGRRVTSLSPCVARVADGGALRFGGGDLRALADAWERCYGECGIVRLTANSRVRSAWDLHLFDPGAGRTLTVSYLDIPRSKLHVDIERTGDSPVLDLSVRMDVHAGREGVLIPPGTVIEPGSILFALAEGPVHEWLERYARDIARHNGLPAVASIPTGWVDWYFSFAKTTQEDILKNLDFIARELKDFGLEYVQIDSGWQLGVETSSPPHNTVAGGPWTENSKFARGMKWFAGEIRARGLKPGIWVRPFQFSDGAPERSLHPEWFNSRGQMDISNPEVRRLIRDLFVKLVEEWGFEYIKYDFVAFDLFGEFGPKAYGDALAIAEPRDQSRTSIQIYGDMLGEIRAAVGNKAKILACNSVMPSTLGSADAFRIGDDVGNWDRTFRYGVSSVGPRYFTNGVFWANDPDCLLVREPFTLNQARMWGSLIALSGGIVFISENLAALPQERLEIVKKCLPVYANAGEGYRFGRPIDLFERVPATVWHLPVRRGFASWDVVGLFNWSDQPASRSFDLATTGIAPGDSLLAYDFWKGEFLGEVHGTMSLMLEPMSSRVIALHRATGRPQLLSTSRHVTQGGVELLSLTWDEASGVLSGSVRAVAGNPYDLIVHVPDEYVLVRLDGVKSPEGAAGRVRKWRVSGDVTAPAGWQAHFTKR
jgi:hypothetical protein